MAIWPKKTQPPVQTSGQPAGPSTSPPATLLAPTTPSAEVPPAVKIIAVDKHLMERHGAVVSLPSFEIAPEDPEKPPELTNLKIEGVSEHSPLALWITKAYAEAKKRVAAKPLKQSIKLVPSAQDWPTDQPLTDETNGANHFLSITVEYKPQGADGRPSSMRSTIRQSIRLKPGLSLQPTAILHVDPPSLLKVYEYDHEGRGPLLSIRLKRKSSPQDSRTTSGLQPKLSISLEMIDANALASECNCPGLVSAIEDMLQRVQGTIERDRTDMLLSIRIRPRFRLSADDRGSLLEYLRKNKGSSLQVKLHIKATGAVSQELILELHPQQSPQHCLTVMDLGTSTSVACIFDRSYIETQVFPQEQLEQLRDDFLTFLNHPEKEVGGGAESYWLELLQEVCKQCQIKGENDPARALQSRLNFPINSERGADDFFDLLRFFEMQLWSLSQPFEDAAAEKLYFFQNRIAARLHLIYESCFEKVPLAQWNIRLASVDDEGTDYIVSELELLNLDPLPKGRLGRESADRRIRDLAGKDMEYFGVLREGRFIECPKRFMSGIHKDDDLTAHGEIRSLSKIRDGNEIRNVRLTARQVMQASWGALIETASRWLGSETPLKEAAITFPADLMPEPRGQLKEALYEMGMVTVHDQFDESTSPAIFHLEQLFGNLAEIGCEAFKVQCVKEGTLWAHHMLVLDIGAGTTDISLIRLEMRQSLPDRSDFGGRLYRITPRLLGAAGRSQSGGNLLTLKIFRVLKQIVSHWIVQASKTGVSTASQHQEAKPVLDAEGDKDLAMTKALERAEEVLPTRFHSLFQQLRELTKTDHNSKELLKARQMLERFHTLWNWAENIKIHFSNKLQEIPAEELPIGLPLDDFVPRSNASWLREILEKLLEGTNYANSITEILNFTTHSLPQFKIEDFQQLARTAIERSVSLAVNLATSSLENYQLQQNISQDLCLQSVVLSGRACALPAVQQELAKKLRQEPRLGKGKAKIRFRANYAKSATAIGACRAQCRISRALQQLPTELNGTCEVTLDIDNLLFYLPADYGYADENNRIKTRVLEKHSEFIQFGRDVPLGLIRTKHFELVRPQMSIYRDDGDGDGILRGELVLNNVIGERQLPENMQLSTCRVRFEITHRQELAALIVRPSSRPSDLREVVEVIYDIGDTPNDPNMILTLERTASELLAKAKDDCPLQIFNRTTGNNAQPMIAPSEMIPIRCLGSRATKDRTGGPPTIVRGWLGPVLKTQQLDLRQEGKVTLFLYDPIRKKEAQMITVKPILRDPENPTQRIEKEPFKLVYRIVITTDGRLALVIGEEPPYWETKDVDEWLASPEGRILRRELLPGPQKIEWWREPFCGKH